MKQRLALIAGGIAVAVLSLAASPAAAKQCVWNKGWFVLKVRWYEPDALTLEAGKEPLLRSDAQPVQIDEFPAAQGRCLERDEAHYAVLSVVGGKFAADLTRVTVGALVAAGGAAATVVGCGATAGAGCVGAGAGATAAVTSITQAIPDGKEVFAITIPLRDRWTDVWGTVWEPVFDRNVGGAF
jgi:hypothetical protein